MDVVVGLHSPPSLLVFTFTDRMAAFAAADAAKQHVTITPHTHKDWLDDGLGHLQRLAEVPVNEGVLF